MAGPAPTAQPLAAILGRPDCFPVGLSPDQRRIVWRDVGDCRFTHAVFPWSLEAWAAEHALGDPLETDLADLGRPEVEPAALPPTVFVFHMSRCGSSLLARALAHSPRIIVMSELPAVNAVLRVLCGADLDRRVLGPLKRRRLRNLILLLGRRRRPTDTYFAVKFSSWNVLLVESIRAAFPEVPRVFIYREPAEVLVSLLQRPPGWVRAKHLEAACSLAGVSRTRLDAMSETEYVASCLQRTMTAALSSPGMHLLSYADLTRESFPRLLEALGITCPPDELAAMRAVFDTDSKSRHAAAPFLPDAAAKRREAGDEIREAAARYTAGCHAALEASGRNLRGRLHSQGPAL